MQRKLEPLPGLSNVTGKYTKKCTDEPYPRLLVHSTNDNRSDVTSQMNKLETSGVHNPDFTAPTHPSNPMKSSNVQSGSDFFNNSKCVPGTYKGQNSQTLKSQYSTSKLQSTHQHVLSTEPHTSSGGRAKPQKSNVPVKPQDIQRTKRYMKEVVKSSSSGSVSALQSKPTGVIIATPCSPHVNEQGLTRSFDGLSVSGRVTSSNSFSGSKDSFHLGSERTSFSRGKDFNHGWFTRPCDVSGYSHEIEGGILTKEQSSEPQCSLNFAKISSGVSNPQCHWKRFSDNQVAYRLSDGRFCNATDYKYPSNNGHIHICKTSDYSNDSSNKLGGQHSFYCEQQEKRDTNDLNRASETQLYGFQSRHASLVAGELSNSGMPGPQCTQNALEHYLSDLIADEQRLVTNNPCTDSSYSYCETPSRCGNHSFDPTYSETEKKTCSTDLLQFLEQRIENALQKITSMDSKPSSYYGAQNRVRPNRSASLNPVCEPRMKSVESPSVVGNFYQYQTTFQNDYLKNNYHENSTNTQNRQLTGSYSGKHSCSTHPESNMLQQFNFDELRYILKAVKDLLALRTSPAHKNVSQGQDRFKIAEPDKQRKCSKTERLDTCAMSNRDDQSICGRTGAESPYISRSVSSSRSSSAVRTNRFETPSESRSGRVSSGMSEDGSHSNADLMHQRLPIGFQHFERYLDSKFGPDHPANGTSASTSDVHSKPESYAKLAPMTSGYSPSLLPGNPSDYNSHIITKQKPQSSVPIHLETNHTATIVTGKPVETDTYSSTATVSQYPGYLNEAPYPVYTNMQSDYSEQTEWNSDEKLGMTNQVSVSACNQPNLITHSHNGYVSVPPVNHSTSYTGSTDGNTSHTNYHMESSNILGSDLHQGQQLSNWPPNWYQWYISSHMFPQRSPSCSQFPYHHYYYPHLKQQHQQQQQFTFDHTICPHKINRLLTPLPYVMNSPPNYSPSGHLYCMDANHTHLFEGSCASPCPDSCHFVSYESQSAENPFQAIATSSGLCSCTNLDGMKRFANVNYTYADRIPTNSYTAYRPSGVYSPPPGYPWFPCMNSVRWDPFSYNNFSNSENYNWNGHFQRPACNRFTNCMPRSGSANAGFTCSSETDTLSNHTSERGTALELDRFRQNNNRWDHYYAVNPNDQVYILSDQTNDAQSFMLHHNNNNNVLQSPALRSMTNSFSANDLAAYHNQGRIGIRYTKSSFELAPELPVEPGLALMDHSNFYSKISSLIEMDNNVRLILPNGWSERRSGLGRSYYTCDSSRRSTWNHPLVGPYIPLGWERVDSTQAGVYYQNLLIPHCQRYHPNLWINAPLKDPEVERKSFFTDLRKLQLSLRHNLLACHAEIGAYKNASSDHDQYFINRFRYLKLESLMEIIYGLDQLFYQDLHALVVSFEQERMSIVSHMFAIRPPEKTFPQFTDS
ncbi:hypothetical protein MN116_003963 [Schistosoma mekongi]|uniref:WW domain-containing protein n=1 Tax=Schistosoma mekongi TaxID=38744 RepID=A0AAE1ZFY2_SCHME|nr:hypothetical protein MN116_003963 [Schistosoma mekongi]